MVSGDWSGSPLVPYDPWSHGIDAPAAADNVKASSGAIGIQVCCAGPNSYNMLKESLSSAGVEEGTSCYISSQENGSRDVGNLFEQYHDQRANVFSRD